MAPDAVGTQPASVLCPRQNRISTLLRNAVLATASSASSTGSVEMMRKWPCPWSCSQARRDKDWMKPSASENSSKLPLALVQASRVRDLDARLSELFPGRSHQGAQMRQNAFGQQGHPYTHHQSARQGRICSRIGAMGHVDEARNPGL